MARPRTSEALLDWREIADLGWKTLLLGNGMSINVSPRFDYQSLYEEADFEEGLSDRDRAIFEVFDARNFEVVLSKLRDGIALAEVLGRKTGPYKRRFESVQAALGQTVRKVHLSWLEVPDATLGAIKDSFMDYRTIFSTSYDLLAYWAIAHRGGYRRFCDCFWANDRNEFDAEDCEVRRGHTPIYYMHGALHLIVGGSGTTRKLTREDLADEDEELLDNFGKPVPGDPKARPLLVTEGSPRDKLQAIEANDYLSHIYETLKEDSEPLLVFGHSLGAQDQHLTDAIKANPDRPVAISIHDEGDGSLHQRRHEILAKLQIEEDVYFYEAASHPLGSPELRVGAPAPAPRRARRTKPTRSRAIKRG